MWGLDSCVAMFMTLIIVCMHIIWQGVLWYCVASFLIVVIVHLRLCILLFLLSCVGCFVSLVISGQHITYCSQALCMRCYHNLLHLLHQSLRFDSLIIKFLDHLIDLLPVAYADKLIKNIYKVFFHQVE
jgi:hypothetical protein